jgi:hypothetical protein
MPADVAVEAILRHREHVEVIHRLQALNARRTYSYFQANSEVVPSLQEPLERCRVSFESAVGSYFESKRCGRGTIAAMHLCEDSLDLTVSQRPEPSSGSFAVRACVARARASAKWRW